MRLADVVIAPEQEGREKHVPSLEAPAKVKKGERFDVKVHVGKETPHPNTIVYHSEGVKLFAKEDGPRPVAHVAAAEFGPTYGEPIITFTLKLEKTTDLIALSQCNLHGL